MTIKINDNNTSLWIIVKWTFPKRNNSSTTTYVRAHFQTGTKPIKLPTSIAHTNEKNKKKKLRSHDGFPENQKTKNNNQNDNETRTKPIYI